MGTGTNDYRLEDCLCPCGGYLPHHLTINKLAELDDVVGKILEDSGYGEITIQFRTNEKCRLTYSVSRNI